MGIGYVLYNPTAGNKDQTERIKVLETMVDAELKFIDILKIKDYQVFLSGLEKNDFIIIAGGDGTLNRFVNNTDGIAFDNEILHYPNGTGNDFALDLGYPKECVPFPITQYLKNLPYVIVNGKKYRFINGIGYGIDGYCCEEGDRLKQIPGKKVNYGAIAIKGMIYAYKPTNAKITVDGKTYTYKKVWLAPTMYGRYYGGGMIPTPEQRRNNEKGTISTMIIHGTGKLKTLIRFPGLFKGEHVKYKDMVDIHSGYEIKVEFDQPTALQIDGETILGVTSYTALSPALVQKKQAAANSVVAFNLEQVKV